MPFLKSNGIRCLLIVGYQYNLTLTYGWMCFRLSVKPFDYCIASLHKMKNQPSYNPVGIAWHTAKMVLVEVVSWGKLIGLKI